VAEKHEAKSSSQDGIQPSEKSSPVAGRVPSSPPANRRDYRGMESAWRQALICHGRVVEISEGDK